MSLIDKLREAALPPSHDPTGSEIAQIVGRLIAYVEHGEAFLEAAKKDAAAFEAGEDPPHEVDRLLSPESFEEQDQAAAAQPSSPAAPAAAPAGPDKDAEIASLKEQLAIAQANAQRTQASVEPGAGPPAAGTPSSESEGGHA